MMVTAEASVDDLEPGAMGKQRDVDSVWSDVRSLGPPGSFVPLKRDGARPAATRPPRRWSYDATALALLSAGLVPAAAGALLAGAAGYLVAAAVSAPPWWGFAVAAVWLMSGPLALTRTAARLLARLHRCRPPTRPEAVGGGGGPRWADRPARATGSST